MEASSKCVTNHLMKRNIECKVLVQNTPYHRKVSNFIQNRNSNQDGTYTKTHPATKTRAAKRNIKKIIEPEIRLTNFDLRTPQPNPDSGFLGLMPVSVCSVLFCSVAATASIACFMALLLFSLRADWWLVSRYRYGIRDDGRPWKTRFETQRRCVVGCAVLCRSLIARSVEQLLCVYLWGKKAGKVYRFLSWGALYFDGKICLSFLQEKIQLIYSTSRF